MGKFISLFCASLVASPAFAGADLLPEAGWISSMSITVLTCPRLGMDCARDLRSARTKLEAAGFTILKTEACAPRRTDSYRAACPGGGEADQVASIHFVK